jgi:hypothetical protein
MEDMNTIRGMDRKQKIRRGLLWASGDWKKEELAEITGTPRTRLSTFLQGKGEITDAQMDEAEKWLRERAYWSDIDTAGATIDATVAEDLEALAKVLKSPDYPRELKARKFKAWIVLSHDSIEDLVKALLRGK